MSQFQIPPVVKLPKVKVCGVTRRHDLDFIAAAGVDTVGINLVPSSKRFVPLQLAGELCQAAQQLGLLTTAILRNPTGDWLHSVQGSAKWDFIQLHGSETPELVAHCPPISVIKAVSWSGRAEEVSLVQQWIDWAALHRIATSQGMQEELPEVTSRSIHSRLACFLIDAYAPTEGGGTGRIADWRLLYPRPTAFQDWKILLAGGLTPDNVQLAIRTTVCDGIDTASGVEHSPGHKSHELVSAFVKEAKKGFSESVGRPLQ